MRDIGAVGTAIWLWIVGLGCTAPQVAVCGNGRAEASETCDDGNTRSGDGCSAECRLESPADAGAADGGGGPSDGGDGDGAGDGGAGADAGEIEIACGTRGLAPCPAGLDCVFPLDAACGSAGSPGTCRRRPDACTREVAWVCGCDGVTYVNECEAHRAGTSAARSGTCGLCDPRNAICDAAPPRCVAEHYPAVRDGCWDGCVPLSACTCSTDAECPEGACQSSGVCGR